MYGTVESWVKTYDKLVGVDGADYGITITHHYVLSVGLRMLPSAELADRSISHPTLEEGPMGFRGAILQSMTILGSTWVSWKSLGSGSSLITICLVELIQTYTTSSIIWG